MGIELKKTDGIILRVQTEGETSKLCTVYTRNDGKVRLVAKGARKPLSKLASAIDTANLIELVYYHKPERQVHYITQATIIDQFQNIKRELDKFRLISCILELTDLLTPIGDENRKIFNLLLRTIRTIENNPERLILSAYALKLLALQGFKPELGRCVECGKGIVEDIPVRFSFERGGIVCYLCEEKIGEKSMYELRPDLRNIVDRLIKARLESVKSIRLSLEQYSLVCGFVKMLIVRNAEVSNLKCAELE